MQSSNSKFLSYGLLVAAILIFYALSNSKFLSYGLLVAAILIFYALLPGLHWWKFNFIPAKLNKVAVIFS